MMHVSSLVLKVLLSGYLLGVLIETPVLFFGLSRRYSFGERIFAGLWLTACTYPIVILVIPYWVNPQTNTLLYILIAETFAPLAECALFWVLFGKRDLLGQLSMWRDFGAITLANVLSFAAGELLRVVWRF